MHAVNFVTQVYYWFPPSSNKNRCFKISKFVYLISISIWLSFALDITQIFNFAQSFFYLKVVKSMWTGNFALFTLKQSENWKKKTFFFGFHFDFKILSYVKIKSHLTRILCRKLLGLHGYFISLHNVCKAQVGFECWVLVIQNGEVSTERTIALFTEPQSENWITDIC